MKTSIVITCYNYAQYVDDAIQSCIKQTTPCEIIVVDDGSTDNTEEVCKKYKEIKYIKQENKGVSCARNTGISNANGEYIICLDADDTLDLNYVEVCEKKMEEGYDIVATPFMEFGDSNNYYSINKNNLTLESFKTGNRIHCASMFKRIVHRFVGGYDENMLKKVGFEGWEDYLLWVKMLKMGALIGIAGDTKLNYRKHGASMIDNTKSKENQLRMKKYIDEGLK